MVWKCESREFKVCGKDAWYALVERVIWIVGISFVHQAVELTLHGFIYFIYNCVGNEVPGIEY